MIKNIIKTNCKLPWQRLKIDSDGFYNCCCHQSVKYGNVLDDDWKIENALNSGLGIEVQKCCSKKELHNICNNNQCPFFSMEKKIIKEEKVLETKYPYEIELGLHSSLCNVGGLNPTPKTACFMCPRASVNPDTNQINTVRDRTDDILEKIKPAIPFIKSFCVLGIAEPFFKNKLFEIFDKLEFEKSKQKVFFWTNTNGNIFFEKMQDRYLECVASNKLHFSLDAATPSIYEKIRRGDKKTFEQTLENIKSYTCKIKNRKNCETCNFVNINKVNLYDMINIINLSEDLGIQQIIFRLTHPIDGQTPIELEGNLICNENNWREFWEMQKTCEEFIKTKKIEVLFYVPFHGGFLK